MSTPIFNVKNVSLYPMGGLQPVITGAEGLYTTIVNGFEEFIDLNLFGGQTTGSLILHNKYVANGEYIDGRKFHTPSYLICTATGAEPKFQRIIPLPVSAEHPEGFPVPPPPYINLFPLTDVTVTWLGYPTTPIVVRLIENATAEVIATRIGTPHLMGASVTGGKRNGKLEEGMDNIIITGKTKDGHSYTLINQTCINPKDPAIFFRLLA